MCLIAALLPQYYLNASFNNLNFQVPFEKLEYDCRGKMDLAVDGSSAYIEVGEIKSVAEYSIAVTQLGIRLAVLKHAANIITGVNKKNIRLSGRLFLPAYNRFQAAHTTQRQIAERKWNYTLHVAEI